MYITSEVSLEAKQYWVILLYVGFSLVGIGNTGLKYCTSIDGAYIFTILHLYWGAYIFTVLHLYWRGYIFTILHQYW